MIKLTQGEFKLRYVNGPGRIKTLANREQITQILRTFLK